MATILSVLFEDDDAATEFTEAIRDKGITDMIPMPDKILSTEFNVEVEK